MNDEASGDRRAPVILATHDFENRSAARAGLLDFSQPGAFEPEMPGIAEWFKQHPPGRAGDEDA